MEQRIARIEAGGILQAHHGGQAPLQQLHHQAGALRVVGRGQLAAQGRSLRSLLAGGAGIQERLQHRRLTTAKLARQPGPVVVEHRHAAGPAPLEQQTQGLKGLLGRQQAHPQGLEAPLQALGHAGAGPGAPLHRQQGTASLPRSLGSGGGQAIEGAIGDGVAGLPRRPQQRRHR